MLSESARMNSAAEARFRVQAPNSAPRAVKVIALDAVGDAVVKRLAAGGWPHATFMTASVPNSPLQDIDGRERELRNEVAAADLVVMIAGPGGHAHGVDVIGAACSRHRVMTTALVVGGNSAPEEAISQTLAQVRPWSLMVVISESVEYINDMLIALRA